MIMKQCDSWLPHVLVSHEVDPSANLVTITMSNFDSVLLADYASLLDQEGFRVQELEGASELRPARWRMNVVFASTTYKCAIVHRFSRPTIVTLCLPA
jgi:hypothetical protein